MIQLSRGNREREIEFRRRSAVERQDAKAIADTQNESDQYLLATRRQAAAEIRSRIRPQQKRVCDWLRAQGAAIRHEFEILSLLSAEISASLLPALEANPDVLSVDLVGEQNAQLDRSTAALNAPALWRNGFTGAGESVLVLDSGIYAHPAFGGRVIAANFFGNNPLCTPAELTSQALDINGHGTHVAGIVASAGTSAEPNLRGVAYGLGRLYAAKISCGTRGNSFGDVALAATESAISNFQVMIVNNSNGGQTREDYDLHAKKIDQLIDLYELVWVNSAGNDGPTPSSITSPATSYNGISVANFDSTSSTLSVNRSSSRGPTLGGRKKPDIGAPGTNIRSTSNTGSGFRLDTGTSMAAPHIAGAAALLRQAGVRNSLAMKALLLNTTETFGWTREGGWGFANLDRAFQQRDRIALGSLNANRDTIRLYQATIPAQSSFYGTLTWNRHFSSSGQSPLRNFDMALYDQNSGQLIIDSASSIDNVEQVAADNRNASTASVVITLGAPENGSGLAEPFALAASQTLQPLRGPDLRSTCQWPEPVPANATISIACTVTNQGDLASLQSNGSLSSAGVTLATVSFGPIAPRQSSTQRFTIQTGSRSTLSLRLTVRGTGYGIFVEPSVDYTIAIAAPLSCSFSLSASSALLQAPAGTSSVTVSTSGACQWSANGFPNWLSASSVSFTGSGTLSLAAQANPTTIERSVTLTVAGHSFLVRQAGGTASRQPVVLAVTDAANSGNTISAGAWISIFGTSLATGVSSWTTADFNGRQLPTTLDGVTVTVNGRAAYVAYVSPGQINALTPDDQQTGLVAVIVRNRDGQSVPFSVSKQLASPGLFTYNSNSLRFAAATHPDGTTVAPWGLYPGSAFRPVVRGDTVTLYATGCGPTSPPTPSGESVSRPAPLAGTARVELAGVTIPISFAGVVSSGLCQLNVVVPTSVPRGNLQLVLRVDSYRSASAVVLPVD
jgi:uncharacterized protein (TIGR03437 family)